MNRRHFLGLLVAAPALPYVKLPKPKPLNLNRAALLELCRKHGLATIQSYVWPLARVREPRIVSIVDQDVTVVRYVAHVDNKYLSGFYVTVCFTAEELERNSVESVISLIDLKFNNAGNSLRDCIHTKLGI